jgi:hypothetical protein
MGCGAGQNTVQTLVEDGQPYTVPQGGGVITAWQHRASTVDVGSGRLQVWRGSALGTTFTLVGRSEIEAFSAGLVNSFATRIPVDGGDLLGFRITNESACVFDAPGAGPNDTVRFQNMIGTPDAAPGESVTFGVAEADFRLNISATLEPDADGDGFGDETQDCNPGNASQTVDCTPPDAVIVKGAKSKTKKKRATFEFTGSDARAVAGFECSLDGAAFSPCTSPHTVKVKKGKHTFSVRAIDQAGNVDGTPAADSWKVKRKKKKR